MANNRIFYATHQSGIMEDGGSSFTEIHGLQSMSTNTNFNLQQIFEHGQAAIYENIEDIPDVEITLNKVLDGYPLMYCLATVAASTPDLLDRSAQKCVFATSIFADTAQSASGTPGTVAQSSGMYVGSHGLNFVVDGPSNEDMTLVGNDRVWLNDPRATNPNLPTPSFAGAFSSIDSPIGVGGVSMRENVMFTADGSNGLDVNGMVADSDCTILPPEVYGVTSSGVNIVDNAGSAKISSISISVDFARESINTLGKKSPFFRYAGTPVEVTTQIEVTANSGDVISAVEEGIYSTGGTGDCEDSNNLKDRTIRVATCEGTRVYLGTKNKLSSSSYSGGDAGGDNVSISYTFTTFNDYTVMHSGDPNGNFAWGSRDTYLRDV